MRKPGIDPVGREEGAYPRPKYKPRPKAWLKARLGGYLWRRCPTCGRKFGGHENPGIVRGIGERTFIICHQCMLEREAYRKRKEQQ